MQQTSCGVRAPEFVNRCGVVAKGTDLHLDTVHIQLQKISVALWEALALFLFFSFRVERLEVSPKCEDHNDSQPIGRNTYRVRLSVTLTPGRWPDVGASDITQLTERVDERDSDSSLRGWTGERGTNPCKKCDECGVGLGH